MKPVDEHLASALAVVEPLPPLYLPLLDALDCVLAEDVVAGIDLPSFDNSAMDGYAVVLADVAGASAQQPVRLPVVADLPAGVRESMRMAPGTAVRIMTGAPVPQGAEAIVPVEATDRGVAHVEIRRGAAPGEYIRRIGEDVQAGTLVLEAGTRLGARHVGTLAATGRDRVKVRPRPRVVVLSTGSEIVEPGKPPGFGQVCDANGYALTAAALDVGAQAYRVGIAPDDARQLMSTLEDQLVRADLVITSGGVSAGAYDTVKDVLSQLGTVRFDKVAMQPGMPQGFGTLGPDDTPVFTLPGNPVSAYVSFEVFVRPVLRKMLGETALHRRTVPARASEGWRSPDGKRQYARGALSRDEAGQPEVRPVGGHGSHLTVELARADVLAVVPEDVTQVQPGDLLTCLLLERGRR